MTYYSIILIFILSCNFKITIKFLYFVISFCDINASILILTYEAIIIFLLKNKVVKLKHSKAFFNFLSICKLKERNFLELKQLIFLLMYFSVKKV